MAVTLPSLPPLQETLVTVPLAVMIRTRTTWSAAPARMQASPPMMRRMYVSALMAPIIEPGRSWPVAPTMLVQFTLSVLICHW
ncbi:MAG: hypothetical protein GFGODING_02500 [Flavobacteriales bacterium]|nr:hypothetical protein [Flavobacteriales bacterium]